MTASAPEPLTRRPPANSTVLDRLLDATVGELRESGYAGTTVRLVARRAGVSPATAYNYVSSKDHLVAAFFWRELSALTRPPEAEAATAAARVGALVAGIGAMVMAEPALVPAYRAALLTDAPDASRVRDAIAAHLMGEFTWALGDELSDEDRECVQLAFIGAMTIAGSGMIDIDTVVRRVTDLVDRLSRTPARTTTPGA